MRLSLLAALLMCSCGHEPPVITDYQNEKSEQAVKDGKKKLRYPNHRFRPQLDTVTDRTLHTMRVTLYPGQCMPYRYTNLCHTDNGDTEPHEFFVVVSDVGDNE